VLVAIRLVPQEVVGDDSLGETRARSVVARVDQRLVERLRQIEGALRSRALGEGAAFVEEEVEVRDLASDDSRALLRAQLGELVERLPDGSFEEGVLRHPGGFGEARAA